MIGKWALDDDSGSGYKFLHRNWHPNQTCILQIWFQEIESYQFNSKCWSLKILVKLQAWFDLTVDDKYMRKLDKYCKNLCRLQPVLQYINTMGQRVIKWRVKIKGKISQIFRKSFVSRCLLMKIRKAELDDHKQAVVSIMCKESERLGRFC